MEHKIEINSINDIFDKINGNFTGSNIMLVDKSVSQSNVFIESTNTNTLAIGYKYYTDKQKLLDYLNSITQSFDRLCFVFDNSSMDNKLFLNTLPFFTPDDIKLFFQRTKEYDINKYSENIVFIVNLINHFNVKNIDFLACKSLQYSEWRNYYEILKTFTQCIVGASNDLTGNLQYGGNWTMENTNEDIKNIYFNGNIDNYSELLFATSITAPFVGPFNYYGGTLHLINIMSKRKLNLTNFEFNFYFFSPNQTKNYVLYYRKINTTNWFTSTNTNNLNINLEPNIMYEILLVFEYCHFYKN